MTTAVFFAARTLVDRLTDLTRPGLPLDGVQVAYSFPGAPGQRCVYLGELPFSQAAGPTAGDRDTLAEETGTVALYVRVTQPLAQLELGADPVRAADTQAEAIGDAIGDYLNANPRALGPNTSIALAGGRRDYFPTDDEAISSLRLDLTYTAYL